MSRGQLSASDRKNRASGISYVDSAGKPLRRWPKTPYPYQMYWGIRSDYGWKGRQGELDGMRRGLAGVPAQSWPLDVPGNTRARRSRKWRRAHRAFPPGGIPQLYQINEPSNFNGVDE